MSYWLIGFLSGIFAMSAFATIGMALIDEGKDWGIWFGGIAAWILLLYCHIYRGITRLYRRLNYRALMVCPDGEVRSCPSDGEIPDALRELGYSFAKFDKEKWNVAWWSERYITKHGHVRIVSMRYTPRKVWKDYEKISKETITQAMDAWNCVWDGD